MMFWPFDKLGRFGTGTLADLKPRAVVPTPAEIKERVVRDAIAHHRPDMPVHDRSAWRKIGGTSRSLGTLTECTRCNIRWDAKYQKSPCSCTLPRRVEPVREPYPGYGLHPKHGRNAMPPPAPPAPARYPNRTTNQEPPFKMPESPRNAAAEQVESEASQTLQAGQTEFTHGSDRYRLNTARDVAVATEVFWNEDMGACPRGVKLQLLSIGGVAQYDTYKGESFWVGWAPVPRRRPA